MSKKPRLEGAQIVPYSVEQHGADIFAMLTGLQWNPGVDLAHIDQHDAPGGVLVAVDSTGRMIGMVSGNRHGSFGWVGMYIVRDEDMRGRGLGMQLWRAMMDGPLKGCSVMGLDSVDAQVSNYQKAGFVHTPYHVARHSGVLQPQYPRPGLPTPVAVTTPELAAACARFDRDKVFTDKAIERSEFIARWVQMPGAYALAVVDHKDNCVLGFAVLRPAVGDTMRLGPLMAGNVDVADALLRGMAKEARGRSVDLDVPDANKFALDLAARYAGSKPPEEHTELVYGVCCWERTC